MTEGGFDADAALLAPFALSRLLLLAGLIVFFPGLMVLVPGSLGFRGLASIFQSQVLAGLDTAFQMLFLAASLLFGVLLANLVSPETGSPRRRGGHGEKHGEGH